MKIIKCLLISLLFISSFLIQAEEETTQTVDDNHIAAYISDDLFIYMHAGPGNNYRILGSINAGDEVKMTGEVENGYTQITDNKKRVTWVETKYVSTNPGLRAAIAELNSKLANNENNNQQISIDLEQANTDIAQYNERNTILTNEITELKQKLTQTESQLSNQDLDLKKEYFFNGAIVLVIGLILGLVLPRLSVRKKGSMESWK
ncbi:MAG: TIGR04211 family SH3 domain-containing protein [Colwelliaceae bacterium]|nr:TIGR04211 family SH3 domain-containing protein [Colwelliaceae bacterium]